MIERLRIENFKALREAEVQLTPLHLLIGQNDSGKTSVLQALAAVCRSIDHEAPACFLGRWQGRELVHWGIEKPEVQLSVRVSEEAEESQSPPENWHYTLVAEFPATNREAIWQKAEVSSGKQQLNVIHPGSKSITIPAYEKVNPTWKPDVSREILAFVPRLKEQLSGVWYLRWNARTLALPVALNPARQFRIEGDGFGLATLLDDLLNYDRELFAGLEQKFLSYFPQVKSIALQQTTGFDGPVGQVDETPNLSRAPGKQILFRMRNSEQDLPASQAAEGMLYLLGYLALLHLPDPPRVLLIEEPENGIHPHRLVEIVALLRQLVHDHPRTQIVLTSHSPYLVDGFEAHEVTWCHRDQQSGEITLKRLDTLPEVERQLDLFSLGEIWTSELEGAPLEQQAQ